MKLGLIARMRAHGRSLRRAGTSHAAWSGLGGGIAIALVAGLADASDAMLLMPPLGASAVLAFAVYESPLAQPRNILGGHLLTGAIGLAFYTGLGSAWWVMALACACAIVVMVATRTVHPPAGANPILIMMTDASWWFLATPIAAGAALLLACAVLFNKAVPGRTYPTSWF